MLDVVHRTLDLCGSETVRVETFFVVFLHLSSPQNEAVELDLLCMSRDQTTVDFRLQSIDYEEQLVHAAILHTGTG